MDEFCPICGCRTEQPDFTEHDIPGLGETSMCGFCSRQLSLLEKRGSTNEPSDEKTASALRWLESVVQKEVPGRAENIGEYLSEQRDAIAQSIPGYSAAHQQAGTGTSPANPAVPYFSSPAFQTPVMPYYNTKQPTGEVTLQELNERLTKLEKGFSKFKRGLLITSILEVVIPLILAVIIAIIFFKSDLWESFTSLVSPALGVDDIGALF